MTTHRDAFEALLDRVAKRLGDEVRQGTESHAPDAFQRRVFDLMVEEAATGSALKIDPTFHPHAFPDIRANGFGVEVKSTIKDSWLSVGNSIFEGMRDPNVVEIYVMFGKLGGLPAVKWARELRFWNLARFPDAPDVLPEAAHVGRRIARRQLF